MEVDIRVNLEATISPRKPVTVSEQIRIQQAEIYVNHYLYQLSKAVEEYLNDRWLKDPEFKIEPLSTNWKSNDPK